MEIRTLLECKLGEVETIHYIGSGLYISTFEFADIDDELEDIDAAVTVMPREFWTGDAIGAGGCWRHEWATAFMLAGAAAMLYNHEVGLEVERTFSL